MAGEAQAVSAGADDLRVEIKGALALITLSRVKAHNALNHHMRAKLAEAYPEFARDPQVYAVVQASLSPKAFSTGADVREMARWGREDLAAAKQSFKDEYALNWSLECFSKPTVSLINGMVMGSGVGISIYGTHRVAGAGYQFAMPETAIGFFPDVGVMWWLARMPAQIGTYLALTGRRVGRADAYALGLVTHCIDADDFEDIQRQLADAQPVDALLDGLHRDPGPGDLPERGEIIERCFSGERVEDILERLDSVAGPHDEWADSVGKELLAKSPLALKVTLRHIRAAEAMDLENVLQIDARLACRFLESHDFYEGIRAALVDKDQAPKWKPGRLEDVQDATVDGFFEPMPGEDLVLPPRPQMPEAMV